MKNKTLNLSLLILALSLVLYFTLKDNFSSIMHELSKVNILIFALAIFVFILSLMIKSVSLQIFIKEHKKNYSFKSAFCLTLIGQFLNGITPFSTGGQPFQVYLLKKDGHRISDSTSAMVKDSIAYQVALLIMGIFSITLNLVLKTIPVNSSLTPLIIIGFLINIMVLLFLFMIIRMRKTTLSLINKLLLILNKIRKKNTDQLKKRIEKGLDNFYNCYAELRKNKKQFIITVLTNVINLTLLYMIPYIIFKSLNTNTFDIMRSIMLTSFVMLMGNFVPIPGATGGIEYGFIKFFGIFNTNISVISGAMLLWRFVTYFFGMLMGFIMLIIKEGTYKNENRSIF